MTRLVCGQAGMCGRARGGRGVRLCQLPLAKVSHCVQGDITQVVVNSICPAS